MKNIFNSNWKSIIYYAIIAVLLITIAIWNLYISFIFSLISVLIHAYLLKKILPSALENNMKYTDIAYFSSLLVSIIIGIQSLAAIIGNNTDTRFYITILLFFILLSIGDFFENYIIDKTENGNDKKIDFVHLNVLLFPVIVLSKILKTKYISYKILLSLARMSFLLFESYQKYILGNTSKSFEMITSVVIISLAIDAFLKSIIDNNRSNKKLNNEMEKLYEKEKSC